MSKKNRTPRILTANPAPTPDPILEEIAAGTDIADAPEDGGVCLDAMFPASKTPIVTDATTSFHGKSIVARKYKSEYRKHGRPDDCGDAMAIALKAAVTALDSQGRAVLDLAACSAIALRNHVDFTKWKHLNPGQQRMNLGNVLRHKLQIGVSVVIDGEVFEGRGAPRTESTECVFDDAAMSA